MSHQLGFDSIGDKLIVVANGPRIHAGNALAIPNGNQRPATGQPTRIATRKLTFSRQMNLSQVDLPQPRKGHIRTLLENT